MQSNSHTCNATFQAPLLLRNPHVQTLWSRLSKYQPISLLHIETIRTYDNDFIDLAWSHSAAEVKASAAPIVVIFHGLEGSAKSAYVDQLIQAVCAQQWQAVVMQFRSCSGRMNATARAYHSGDTQDAVELIQQLRLRYPERKLFAAGFSLGGNMLVKLLGEQGHSPLQAAACISAPLALGPSSERINRGMSRLYRNHLLNSLKHKTWQKIEAGLITHQVKLTQRALFSMRTFAEFDHEVTAPLHGFSGADDYYQQCSGLAFLPAVRTPLLVLHAKDDPFTCDACIPAPAQIPPAVRYELQQHGGHVGFYTQLSAHRTGQLQPWLPHKLMHWFKEF